jgi:predicted phage terminase large subunit-like protein
MPNTKVERVNLVSPQFEAGRIFVPQNSNFTDDFIHELAHFPNAKHDDIVDATTQYLIKRLNLYNKVPQIRRL